MVSAMKKKKANKKIILFNEPKRNNEFFLTHKRYSCFNIQNFVRLKFFIVISSQVESHKKIGYTRGQVFKFRHVKFLL